MKEKSNCNGSQYANNIVRYRLNKFPSDMLFYRSNRCHSLNLRCLYYPQFSLSLHINYSYFNLFQLFNCSSCTIIAFAQKTQTLYRRKHFIYIRIYTNQSYYTTLVCKNNRKYRILLLNCSECR